VDGPANREGAVRVKKPRYRIRFNPTQGEAHITELKCPACGILLILSAKDQLSAPSLKALTVDDVKKVFPQDLQDLLTFEEKGNSIVLKPKQFLDPGAFGRIVFKVQAIGGRYISAGKNSHFEVPLDREALG